MPPSYAIRPYAPADADACRRVIVRAVDRMTGLQEGAHAKLQRHAARPDALEDLAAVYCLVAERQGRVVGLGALDGAEIRRMFVDPDCSGTGIGTALYRRLEAEAYRRGLAELRLDASLNAVGFYRALGFEETRRKTWLLDGLRIENALMRKTLG